MSGNPDAAHRGVQRGKEHVLFQYGSVLDRVGRIRTQGQQTVHQSGFSGIGVADKRNERKAAPESAASLCGAFLLHLLQLTVDFCKLVLDVTTIELQLFLSGTFVGEAASIYWSCADFT